MAKTITLGLGIIVAMLLLMSCHANIDMREQMDKFRATNRHNLTKLTPGLSKSQVLSIMGDTTFVLEASDAIHGVYEKQQVSNPYRTETMAGVRDTFLVLFYHTDVKVLDGAVTDDELTPLVFKDDKLIGWGWMFLEDTAKKYEIRIR